jgi:hypothetical protein
MINHLLNTDLELHSVSVNAIKQEQAKTKKATQFELLFLLKYKKIYLLGFIKSTFLYLSLILAKFLSASMRVLKLPTQTL